MTEREKKVDFDTLRKNKTSNLSSKKNKVEIKIQCEVMLIRGEMWAISENR